MLLESLGSDHEKPPPSLPGAARWMIVERFLLASATGGRAILRAPKRPAESGVAMLRRSGGTGGAVSNTVPGANRTYAFVAPLFGASPTANPVGPTRRAICGPAPARRAGEDAPAQPQQRWPWHASPSAPVWHRPRA